jgi:hypothetical protein
VPLGGVKCVFLGLRRQLCCLAEGKNIDGPLKAKWIGRSDRIGSAIRKMQVDWNAELDPIFQKDLDLECDPRKSDWSEAWEQASPT